MRTFDFSPLFRSTVGFDHVQRLMDAAAHAGEASYSYPPYNIEVVGDDAYRITMAIAGFSPDDIDVSVKEDTLTITGSAPTGDDGVQYLHRGLAGRSFERRFDLASHIKVKDATMNNGLLHVDLVREVPEEMKTHSIKIKSGSPSGLAEKAKKLISGSGKAV